MAVYPAGLPRPIDASLARSESSYVSTSQRHSGTPFYSINADDAPMTFGLTWRFTRSQMAAFRDWLESDNFAVLNGEQFDINLPTDTGIILQSVSFSPDAAPRIDAISGWVYTVSATVIARSYAENIPALSFKTPDNEFSYYFYSQYEYPDILPNPVDSGYRKAEAQRFNLGDVSSGSFSREIQTDDSPVVYDLTITLPINLEPIFRAWLAQDNFNMLKGAPFNMPIVTEYGVLLQVVQFVDGGQPQQSGMTLNTKTYTAKVTARKQMNSPEGLTDATLGPKVVVSMLYPFFVEEDPVSSSIPSVTSFTLKSWPTVNDELSSGLPTVSAFVMREPIIRESVFDELSSGIPNVESFVMFSPIVNATGFDELSSGLPNVANFALTDIVIRISTDVDSASSDIPQVINFILE